MQPPESCLEYGPCTGHVSFQDEVSAAIRAADGVLLVVDAVEGVMLVTEKVVRQALTEGLPIALLITKVDRLITELKLLPADAYHKLHHTIQEVNALIATYSGGVEDLEVILFGDSSSSLTIVWTKGSRELFPKSCVL